MRERPAREALWRRSREDHEAEGVCVTRNWCAHTPGKPVNDPSTAMSVMKTAPASQHVCATRSSKVQVALTAPFSTTLIFNSPRLPSSCASRLPFCWCCIPVFFFANQETRTICATQHQLLCKSDMTLLLVSHTWRVSLASRTHPPQRPKHSLYSAVFNPPRTSPPTTALKPRIKILYFSPSISQLSAHPSQQRFLVQRTRPSQTSLVRFAFARFTKQNFCCSSQHIMPTVHLHSHFARGPSPVLPAPRKDMQTHMYGLLPQADVSICSKILELYQSHCDLKSLLV